MPVLAHPLPGSDRIKLQDHPVFQEQCLNQAAMNLADRFGLERRDQRLAYAIMVGFYTLVLADAPQKFCGA